MTTNDTMATLFYYTLLLHCPSLLHFAVVRVCVCVLENDQLSLQAVAVTSCR